MMSRLHRELKRELLSGLDGRWFKSGAAHHHSIGVDFKMIQELKNRHLCKRKVR